MSLATWREKIKSPEFLAALALILTGSLGFGLGRLSTVGEGKAPIRFDWAGDQTATAEFFPPAESESKNTIDSVGQIDGKFVASRNSTKYHLPWCSGALRIKEENKIWFESVEEARAAGYSPAANCPGL